VRLASCLLPSTIGSPKGLTRSQLVGVDEERTLARLRAVWSDLIAPTVAVNHGRVVKRTGDGIIIEFRSVAKQLRAQGLSYRRIAAELAARGYVTGSGKAHVASAVQKMLEGGKAAGRKPPLR
jgi:class 3 adenylate cyclase